MRPILPGKLQSQFGGSRRNAYILVYRQKRLNNNLEVGKKLEIPAYWKEAVENMNKVNEEQRKHHAEMEN